MPTVYKSKIDWWLAIIILGAVTASAWTVIKAISAGSPSIWLAIFLVGGIGVGLPLWLLLGTSYTIDSKHLRIHSGPFKWHVLISDITSITPTSNFLSSPALSLDRLRINHGPGASIMISPRNKDQFIKELEALRRRDG